MLSRIEIENFKTIDRLKLELGRTNVFIGENGAGKSNILEAIALAAAANSGKLDNEFLFPRGIRITSASLMRPQFDETSQLNPIKIKVTDESGGSTQFELSHDNKEYSKWKANTIHTNMNNEDLFSLSVREEAEVNPNIVKELSAALDLLQGYISSPPQNKTKPNLEIPKDSILTRITFRTQEKISKLLTGINDFAIFSPETSTLRRFDAEGQIEPLGICGEGLQKLLLVLSKEEPKTIKTIKNTLSIFGWFEDFHFRSESSASHSKVEVIDRFFCKEDSYLDLRGANEGFLYLMFYSALFASKLCPKFFAVDNIENSLNPKLCAHLISEIHKVSIVSDKQSILTTHNPAILDGLNLDDDSQRLFAVQRNPDGYTRIKRIHKKHGSELKLSEMFMRGVIGGLPKGF
ncbi:AAA family ATPase [Pseudomonas sp. BF-R-16]|uniref:AAA family ATPase n=1 Tax=Pseudomonas sp. BF-R-16 TaxID=2832362 RepID=UPI001CC0F7FD|nr:AAA family ATPase [Pseudomonas sp. BF-R-16]